MDQKITKLKNRKPGGNVPEVLGVTQDRLLEIASCMKSRMYQSDGDMIIDMLDGCETVEEAISMAFMLGGFEYKKRMDNQRVGSN